DDDILFVNDILLRRSKHLSLPIGDQAFFAYTAAMQHIDQARVRGEKVLVLDGMGNDGYLGHVPPTRERRLIQFPQVTFPESQISRAYQWNRIHYFLEVIGKDPSERLFSGAGFTIDK